MVPGDGPVGVHVPLSLQTRPLLHVPSGRQGPPTPPAGGPTQIVAPGPPLQTRPGSHLPPGRQGCPAAPCAGWQTAPAGVLVQTRPESHAPPERQGCPGPPCGMQNGPAGVSAQTRPELHPRPGRQGCPTPPCCCGVHSAPEGVSEQMRPEVHARPEPQGCPSPPGGFQADGPGPGSCATAAASSKLSIVTTEMINIRGIHSPLQTPGRKLETASGGAGAGEDRPARGGRTGAGRRDGNAIWRGRYHRSARASTEKRGTVADRRDCALRRLGRILGGWDSCRRRRGDGPGMPHWDLSGVSALEDRARYRSPGWACPAALPSAILPAVWKSCVRESASRPRRMDGVLRRGPVFLCVARKKGGSPP